MVRCPSEAATIRAVRLCWSTVFTSTLWFINSCTTCHKMETIRLRPKHYTFSGSLCHCTCQWLCFTALKRGVTPRLLPRSTAAPCSNNRLQTASLPLPAAAVKAGRHKNIFQNMMTEDTLTQYNQMKYPLWNCICVRIFGTVTRHSVHRIMLYSTILIIFMLNTCLW